MKRKIMIQIIIIQIKQMISKTEIKQQNNFDSASDNKIKMKQKIANLLISQQNKWFYGDNYAEDIRNKKQMQIFQSTKVKQQKNERNSLNELQKMKHSIFILLNQAMRGQPINQDQIKDEETNLLNINTKQNVKQHKFQSIQKQKKYQLKNIAKKEFIPKIRQNKYNSQKIRSANISKIKQKIKNNTEQRKKQSLSSSKIMLNSKKFDQLGSDKQLVFKTKQKIRRTPTQQLQNKNHTQKNINIQLVSIHKNKNIKEKKVTKYNQPVCSQKKNQSKPKVQYSQKHNNLISLNLIKQTRYQIHESDQYIMGYRPVTLSVKNNKFYTLNSQNQSKQTSQYSNKSVLRRLRFDCGKKLRTENNVSIL